MKKLLLLLQILQIKLQILLLRQKLTYPRFKKSLRIILHHGGGWLDFKGVDNLHKRKWGFKSTLGYYVGYQYFIETNGKVYQARTDTEEGAHTIGKIPHYLNRTSIGICLMGNGVEKDFTKEQYKSLKELLYRLLNKYNIKEVEGHNYYSRTLCPSKRLTEWLREYKKDHIIN